MERIEVSSQEKSKDDNKIVKIAKSIKKLAKDDPRRVTHSFKVGLALTLVSLLYYWRPLYDGFGISGMWAVLTVVVIFEFTVGATLSKGLNRGFATLLAGGLGVGAQHLSSLFGKEGEPFVLGILVFTLAGGSTFSRFYPKIKARYDYGVVIFILTFSMISVSGYRVEQLSKMAHQRLSTILIGGTTCIFISIFVCPVWAGQDLHNLSASNIEKLANSLQGFGGQYFKISQDGETVIVSTIDKSCFHSYKSVLNSKVTEEALAIFASWEPRHGRFRFRHPWKQYLKIGTLVRQCGYQIEVLNSHINSNIQVSSEFLKLIEASCTKMSNETIKALRAIALSIKTMRQESISINEHLMNSNKAVKDLKLALEVANLENTELLEILPAATVTSILVEIVKCVEDISEAVNELSQKADFKKAEANVSVEVIKPQLLHKGTIQPVLDGEDDSAHHVIIIVTEGSDSPDHQNEIYHQPPKPQVIYV